MPFPKIELHVHLEGTIGPDTLIEIARRNGYSLGADTAEAVRDLNRFRDFDHFIEIWILTTNALRTANDFRRVAFEYARQAASHGAVYVETIFSPIERVARGVAWDDIFGGYCDGAHEAREAIGIEMYLTPEITRDATLDAALECVRFALKYRDRGVV